MKSKKKRLLNIIVLSLIITGVFSLFGCNNNGNNNSEVNKKTVVSDFERIDVRESGMRVTTNYEYVNLGEETEISRYFIKYVDGKERPELDVQTRVNTQEFIQKLNEIKFTSWNGFHGKHPKGVLDGTMFTLEAKINGGARVYADGSENFPKNYRDFMRWTDELFANAEK